MHENTFFHHVTSDEEKKKNSRGSVLPQINYLKILKAESAEIDLASNL